jgi:hypothetical protein
MLGAGLITSLNAVVGQQPPKMSPLQEWAGIVRAHDLKTLSALEKAIPEGDFITNSNDWSRLWSALRPSDPLPPVNFETNFVVVHTSDDGSGVHFTARRNADGNLVTIVALESLGALGLGYRLQQFKRQGVRAVNGVPLGLTSRPPRTVPASDAATQQPEPPRFVPAEVTGSTSMFFNSDVLPAPDGNCFWLSSKDDTSTNSWRVANMHAENFKGIVANLSLRTVEILPVGSQCCLIVDNRIPKSWLRDRPCSTCLPQETRMLLRETHSAKFRQ